MVYKTPQSPGWIQKRPFLLTHALFLETIFSRTQYPVSASYTQTQIHTKHLTSLTKCILGDTASKQKTKDTD